MIYTIFNKIILLIKNVIINNISCFPIYAIEVWDKDRE